MKKLERFLLVVLIFVITISITGCTNKELNMENKIESEIDFCEGRILVFLKKCEYNDYLENGIYKWVDIEKDTNNFTKSFFTIESDLNYAKYDKNKIEDIKVILQNMNNYAITQNLENLKLEYSKLYSMITNIKLNQNRDFKNKCIDIYISSLSNNKEECNKKITNLEYFYKQIRENSEFLNINKFSLNRINDNIIDLRNALNSTEYQKIRAHALKIIEIM